MSLKNWAKKQGLLMPGIRALRKIEGRFFWFIFAARLRSSTPLLIYQMGKVASSSIYHSLKNVYPGVVLHAHSFSPDHSDWRIRKLNKQTIEHKKPLNIISLTREPIGRNISAFFQNFERDAGAPYRQSAYSLTELNALFLNNYAHNIPLEWFDKNIAATFDIDVYATPFPDCGVATYNKGNIRLLVIRSEIDDEIKISTIRDFLDLPDFVIEYRNIGTNKEYSDMYRSFVAAVQLPSSYISKMCDSIYFNHFYDKDFIDVVRRKWNRTRDPFTENFRNEM